jgi:D-glycero-D-manno-heptose 1,7-bisphosphate phosphatase
VVTNQSAIARGWLRPEGLEQIHAAIAAALGAAGATIDRWHTCPHHPSLGDGPFTVRCDCRKPLPGLLQAALREFAVDPAACVTIGDADRDLEAGERAGTGTVLVGTGKGPQEWRKALARLGRAPCYVPDLAAAAELLLGPERIS